MRELCFQCRGPLGSARVLIVDEPTAYEYACGPKCAKAFEDGAEAARGPRLTTADDLDLAAGQADLEGPNS